MFQRSKSAERDANNASESSQNWHKAFRGAFRSALGLWSCHPRIGAHSLLDREIGISPDHVIPEAANFEQPLDSFGGDAHETLLFRLLAETPLMRRVGCQRL